MKIKVWRKIVVYFYPRPPRGGRQIFLEDNPWNGEFLSTPSARRATHPVTPDLSRAKKFRSTPSARRATALPASAPASDGHFYPRPPRGGRPLTLRAQIAKLRISIHALREEGDASSNARPVEGEKISIHALREEGDGLACQCPGQRWAFLSTPSARRATPDPSGTNRKAPDFYPRPPRGGRRCNPCIDSPRLRFLSTPSARRATRCRPRNSTPEVFLSTPSARRATPVRASRPFSVWYFYPRPPRGGRRGGNAGVHGRAGISIHALREEGDLYLRMERTAREEFLSTPSARRATKIIYFSLTDRSISIHALREEGDNMTSTTYSAIPGISIHALREEGDLNVARASGGHREFLSTPSARRATMGDGEAPAFVFLFLSTPSARRATRTGLRFDGENQSISIHALREEGDSRT